MKSIGIFGGSFNPIHCGHIALAREILRQSNLSEIWLMVSPQNPLKQQANLLADELRLDMARRAIDQEVGIKVSDYECHMPRPSYTWNLLEALHKDYPDCQFSLIIGGDNWGLFDRWYRADDIRKNYPIIVYPRQGDDVPEQQETGITFVEAPLLPVSSTLIRQRVRQGESLEGLVPAGIIDDVRRYYQE